MLLLLVALVVVFAFDNTKSLNYTEFKHLSEEGQIKKLTLYGKERASGEVRDTNTEVVKALKMSGAKFSTKLPYSENHNEIIKFVEDNDRAYRTKLKKLNPEDATEEVVIDPQDEPLSVMAPALLLFILPLIAFTAFFVYFILPKLKDNGGPGFLNNYIRSPPGVTKKPVVGSRLKMSRGWNRRSESCKRSLTSCGTRTSSPASVPRCRRACCSSGRPAPAKR